MNAVEKEKKKEEKIFPCLQSLLTPLFPAFSTTMQPLLTLCSPTPGRVPDAELTSGKYLLDEGRIQDPQEKTGFGEEAGSGGGGGGREFQAPQFKYEQRT